MIKWSLKCSYNTLLAIYGTLSINVSDFRKGRKFSTSTGILTRVRSECSERYDKLNYWRFLKHCFIFLQIPFLEREDIDSLPYVVAATLLTLPVSLHEDVLVNAIYKILKKNYLFLKMTHWIIWNQKTEI